MSDPSITIPSIDISPFLHSPTSQEAEIAISAVRNACLETGFFQITGHGISRELQDQVFAGAKEFFKLPVEEKMKVSREVSIQNGGPGNRGWERIGSQKSGEDGVADCKEGFYFATHYTSNSPPSLAYQTFHGPNLYPAPTTLPYSTFRDPVQTYHSSLLLLSKRLLDLIAATLPYGPTVFDEFMKEDPLAVLRPLYYPASEAKDGEVVIGAGAHTDFGAITLLLQDEIGGLEVWWDNSLNPVIDGVETTDPEFKGPATGPGGAANMQRKEKGGQWIPVKPNRDALVVNLGDMMQMWTRGRYRSTLHRVVCGGAERSSVPFFLDGWLGCVLRPFGDGDAGKGDGEHRYLTVDEHMRERFGSTYVKTESEEKEG